MKKYLIVLSAILLPIIAFAQFSGVSGISDFSPWRLSGTAIQPKISSWTLGSSGTPIGSGFFTNLTTSVITINNSVTGNLTVNGGTINLGASPNTATTTIVANGSGQLTLSAAGTNQNVVLTPSGTGFTLLNGNVGIGTTSPGTKLEVVTSDTSTTFGQTAAQSALYLRNSNTTTNNYVNLAFLGGGGSLAGGAIGTQFTNQSSMTADMMFGTTNAGSFSEKMRITSSGNLGIGTTGPSQLLHVNGASPRIHISDTGTSFSSIDMVTNSANQQTIVGTERAAGGGLFVGSSAYASVFGSAGANVTQFASNNNVRVTIDTSGNLGIGTTSPAVLFSVAGAGYFTGNVGIGGVGDDSLYVLNNAGGSGITLDRTSATARKYRLMIDSSGSLNIRDANIPADRVTINTSGNVGIGTTSPASELAVSSTATTTLHLGTGQSTTRGSCIQMYAPNGTAYRLYVGNGGTLITEAGGCK